MQKRRVVIFGIQDFAELGHYYLMHDSNYEVVAFCVSEKYLPKERSFNGLPLVAFEHVETVYPPGDFLFFAPMSPKGMNKVREGIFNTIKQKGYEFASYVSSKATLFNNKIGENSFILENNVVQPFTDIGDNVVLWSGNHIGHHGIIRSHTSFTSHVVMSGHCVIEPFCFLGVNSTLRDGIVLAEGTLVAMSASVTKDTEAWRVYVGNPAKPIEGKLSTSFL